VEERSPLKRFIRFNQKLGSGALKTVYLGCDTDTGREVAWNVVSIKRHDQIVKKRIKEEIRMLKSLDHPRIIRFINAWMNKNTEEVCFITELVTGGSLLSYIKKIHNPLKLGVMRRWCRQILDGLCYLHDRPEPIIHRDIKCDNIFIDSIRGDVLIGDLGLSTTLKNDCTGAKSIVGTPDFIAPEVYDEKYDTAVDIYAFGMCLLEMVTRASPYEECKTVGEVYRKVLAGEQPRALGRIQDPVLKEIVTSCTRQDPKQRPTAIALLKEKEGAWFQVEEADKDMVCKLIPLEQVPIPEEVHESMCPPEDAPVKLEEVAEASAVTTVGQGTAITSHLTLASQMQDAPLSYTEPGLVDPAPSVVQTASEGRSQLDAQSPCVEPGPMNPAPSVAQSGSQAQSQQNDQAPFVEPEPMDPAPSIAQTAPQLQSQQNAQIPHVEPGQIDSAHSVAQTVSQVQSQQDAQVLCVESGPINPAPSVGESASQVQSQQNAQVPLVEPGPIDPAPSAAQTASQVQSQQQEQVLCVESGPTDPASSAGESASKVQSQQRNQVSCAEPGSMNTAQTVSQVQLQQHAQVLCVESGPTDPTLSVGESASQVQPQQSAQVPCIEPESMDPALSGGESSSHVQSQHTAHAPCIEPGPVGTVHSVPQSLGGTGAQMPSNGAPNTSSGSDVQPELQLAVSNLTSCDAQQGSCLDAHTSAQHSNVFFPAQGLPQAEPSTVTHTAASEDYSPDETDFKSAAKENQSYCNPHDAPECTTVPAAAPEVTTSCTDALSDSANAVASMVGHESDPYSNLSTHQDMSVLDNSVGVDQKPRLQGDENKQALAELSTSNLAAQQASLVDGGTFQVTAGPAGIIDRSVQSERRDEIRRSMVGSPNHSYVTNHTVVDPSEDFPMDYAESSDTPTDEELRQALERAGEEVISTVTMRFHPGDRPSYSVEFDFDPVNDNAQQVAKELKEEEIAPKENPIDELTRQIKRAVIERCEQIVANRDQQWTACHGEVCHDASKPLQNDEFMSLQQPKDEENSNLLSDPCRAAFPSEAAEVCQEVSNVPQTDECLSLQQPTDNESCCFSSDPSRAAFANEPAEVRNDSSNPLRDDESASVQHTTDEETVQPRWSTLGWDKQTISELPSLSSRGPLFATGKIPPPDFDKTVVVSLLQKSLVYIAGLQEDKEHFKTPGDWCSSTFEQVVSFQGRHSDLPGGDKGIVDTKLWERIEDAVKKKDDKEKKKFEQRKEDKKKERNISESRSCNGRERRVIKLRRNCSVVWTTVWAWTRQPIRLEATQKVHNKQCQEHQEHLCPMFLHLSHDRSQISKLPHLSFHCLNKSHLG